MNIEQETPDFSPVTIVFETWDEFGGFMQMIDATHSCKDMSEEAVEIRNAISNHATTHITY